MNNQSEPYEVDLDRLSAVILSGRDNGEKLRKKLELDKKDEDGTLVVLKISDDTKIKSINPSFILGLLGNSIARFKTKEDFYNHYNLEVNETFKPKFEEGIRSCLVSGQSLF